MNFANERKINGARKSLGGSNLMTDKPVRVLKVAALESEWQLRDSEEPLLELM
ncbi:hypothetical protein ABEB36_003738, partial [Hypothenemus hampei]